MISLWIFWAHTLSLELFLDGREGILFSGWTHWQPHLTFMERGPRQKEYKVVASMLPKWVWKHHQILSLGEPGQGSSQRLILTGSLFPFETRMHSPPLDPRSMARTSQGQHAFLKSRGYGQGSSCKTWWRKAFFFYLFKDQEAGMWRMLTSG